MKKISLFSNNKLLPPAIFISLFGLVMIGSASSEVSLSNYGWSMAMLTRHSIYLFIALVVFLITSKIPFTLISKLRLPIILVTVVLLILVLIPSIGREVNGARRWLYLAGISIQPSEIAKLTLILYLSIFLSKLPKNNIQLFEGVPGIIVSAILIILVMAQPDFGTSVIICSIGFGMFFMAGLRYRLILISITTAVVLFLFLMYLQPYRMKRFQAILDPWAYAYDSGYQITQALMAIGRGGWFGTGLGESVQKFFYLPEAHTDFLIAVTIEELGLISCILLLLCYVVLIWRIASVALYAMRCNLRSHSLFVYGVFFYFILQGTLAWGVNLTLLPTTGISLPIFSYGGTSLILSYALLGISQSILYQCEENKKEKSKNES